MDERRATFVKPYGIKVRCSWECVREYNGNLKNISGTSWKIIGIIVLTSWKLIENLLRTHWEQEENEKSLLHLHSLQTHKRHWVHGEPSHLAQVYSSKEDNICQSIWDESKVLLGTHWKQKGKWNQNFFK